MDLIISISRGFVVRNLYYKPIGLNWNKQKTVAVACLQAILQLKLHLHRQHLSVARASKLQSFHPLLFASNSWSDPASCQTIPKDGIGSRQHPYDYIYIIMSLTHPRSVQETPSPCTSSNSTGGSGLEEGRSTGFTTLWKCSRIKSCTWLSTQLYV